MNNEYEKIEASYGVSFPWKYAEDKVKILDKDCFECHYGAAWVTIKKNDVGKWYYIRLNNVSESKQFDELQECISVAYDDMLRAKI